ncbi:MAG: oligosaccharide flippase family protein [Bryobacteraceae bacterium]|jgi:O-antigen/teichoic acid export membrane protein
MSSAQAGAPSQGSLFRSMLHGSGVYSIAILGVPAASMILLPVTTRCLTTADYGVIDLLQRVNDVLSTLLGIGFSSALGYFYFQPGSGKDRRAVVGTAVLGATGLGAAAGLACWPFAGLLSRWVFPGIAATSYLLLVAATMPASFLLEALFGWLRVRNRPTIFTAAALFRVVIIIAGTVALVGLLRLHVWGVLYTSVAAIALTNLGLLVYWFHEVGVGFDARLFARMAKFAAPLGVGGLAMFIVHFGDRFILPHYRSFGEVGVYSLAYKIGMLMSYFYGAFHTYWSAQVFQIMRRDDAEEVFARMFTYVILGLSLCGLGLTVCVGPALRIVSPPAFQGAVAVVPVLVTAYYVRAIGDFLRCLFLALGRPAYDAICSWLGALTCLGAYFALIPPFGMWGAAYATVGAFTVIGAISVIWTYRLRPYRLEAGRLGKIAAALTVSGLTYALIPASSLAAQIGLAALALALFPAMLWLLRFAHPKEIGAAWAAVAWLTPRRFRTPA